MKVVAEKAAELCQGNKECLKAIKEAIKTGALPLKSNGNDMAWSSENPYKAAASLEASKASPTATTQTTDTTPTSTTTQTPTTASTPTSGLAGLMTSQGTEGGDKGQTVISAFGAEKGKDLLNKEITNNEVAGGTPPPPSSDSKTDDGSAKTDERMNGILKDVGISQRDLDKLKNSETPTVKTETGQPAPSKEEVQKAVNTFKRIFYGRPVDKIEGVEKYCVGTSVDLGRAVGILPFTAPYEPFLDYLGNIRDTQGEK